MLVELSAGNQVVSQYFATHIYPFFEQLIGAVRLLLKSDVGSSSASIRVDLWPDCKRSTIARPKTLLSFQATRPEIAMPFVVALQRLRTEVSDADFLEGYGEPFPVSQYAALTKAWM
jgi:hypothetical protein